MKKEKHARKLKEELNVRRILCCYENDSNNNNNNGGLLNDECLSPGSCASGTSASWALTDEQATAFITDSYLRGCWMKMMSAVAEQLEKGVALNLLCGIDAPRIPATCELMDRAAVLKDREVHKLCARVKGAMSTDVGARKKRAGGGSMQCCGGAAANSPASQR